MQGAVALPHILDGTLTHLVDGADFEEDTLFCEWTYFVDWEARTVRVCSNYDGNGKVATVGFAELSVEWMMGFETNGEEE